MVVVVRELQSSLAARIRRCVESGRDPLPVVERLADGLIEKRNHHKLVADGLAVVEHLRPATGDGRVSHMGRRSRQPKSRERGPDLLRRLVEVAGKLNFLVAEGRDSRERAVHVLRHRIAHGVELHADAIDAALLR